MRIIGKIRRTINCVLTPQEAVTLSVHGDDQIINGQIEQLQCQVKQQTAILGNLLEVLHRKCGGFTPEEVTQILSTWQLQIEKIQ